MQRTIIFVAGIHGVGKTSFCQQVATQLGLDHISASTLIRQAKQQSSDQSKAVANVFQNQDILISALNAYQWQSSALLLDGHFCLLTTENSVQPIATATFEHMRPASVILLYDKAETIQQRLQERDNRIYPLDLLERFQATETKQAGSVCAELNIPLLTITSAEVAKALDFIQRG